MKELEATAATDVTASPEQCIALFEDVERYPVWYPEVVRRVEVVERDAAGRAVRATAELHISAGPIVRDFHMLLAVHSESPTAVTLERIPHEPSDDEKFTVAWRVGAGGSRTRVQVRLAANLPVPRLLPVGTIGEGIAQGFVQAAARALQPSG